MKGRMMRQFIVEEMKTIKRHQWDKRKILNPFDYEHTLMGTDIGTNVTVMYMSTSCQHCKELIIVDNVSGKRIRITGFEEAP
jgi:hypothetical protein